MDRETAGIGLLLSVPVGVGVTSAVHLSAPGRLRTAVAFGVVITVSIFLVVLAGAADPTAVPTPTVPAFDGMTTAISGIDLVFGVTFGALVMDLLWFVPLSPVAGGAIGGYLTEGTKRDGQVVGAIAGVIALPLGIGLVVVAESFTGAPVVATSKVGPIVITGAVLAITVYATGLGAVGGGIGAEYAT